MTGSRMIDSSGIPAHYKSFERLLVQVCAPTLAGLKPGSIVSVRAGAQAIRRKVEDWDRRLSPFGLSLRILMDREDLTIVYLCRPSQMEALFEDGTCSQFLQGRGYEAAGFEGSFLQLQQHMRQDRGFPHEVGVFLGYPLTDVKSFIENRGQGCTCCGMWKSWGDPEEMARCFARYDKCVRVYTDLFEKGRPLEKLAVAL